MKFLHFDVVVLTVLSLLFSVEAKFEMETGIDKNVFDHDSRTNTLYVVKGNKIQKIRLSDMNETTIYEFSDPNPPNKTSIVSMSLDWVTKNLYIYHGHVLKVINVDDTSKSPRSLLLSHYNSKGASKVISAWPVVKVFPNQGYLVTKISGKYIF